jgi:hypothetical protein
MSKNRWPIQFEGLEHHERHGMLDPALVGEN